MLTDREREVYDFVRAYTHRHGVPPKLREIGAHLGVASRGTVHRYLRAIEAAGLIAITPDRARGVRLVSKAEVRSVLPVLGRIAAGLPIEAIPDETEIDLSEFFMGPNRFVLRVDGESMIEAGILHGDMVIVESRGSARNGEMVVALIDNQEATLKTFLRNPDGSITLRPANRSMAPMRFAAERVAIQGVVVGQMRSYR
ncbi:MAG TPA: transcriptional repressor LexA [Acidiferrobacterales bacterium]|nr:transcriptional repressor LexA [Acidiferrobacterales bacterium]